MHAQLLNENQKRSVAVTLRLFEERLAEVERMMTVQERGVLYERVAHFTPRQQEQVRALIDEARQVIRDMAREFQLEREVQNPARRIFGLLSITWESLEELHSKPLRAYGAVDPRLPEVIDPYAEKLARLAVELRHAATHDENGKNE